MRVVIKHQELSPLLLKTLKNYYTIRNQMIAINKISKSKRTKGISRGEGYERGLYKILRENDIIVPEPVLYEI